MNKKFIFGVIVSVLLFSACADQKAVKASATKQDQVLSNTQLEIYQKNQPAPVKEWSQLRQNLIEIDNSVGQVVSVPRDSVDKDRNNLCSTGLHFCSKDYLPMYFRHGDRVMLVKVNPADVVSIPSDYDNSKGRCWSYEVVDEVDVSSLDVLMEKSDWDPVYLTESDDFNDDDNLDDHNNIDPLIAPLLPINSSKVQLRTAPIPVVAGYKFPPIKKQLTKDWKDNNKNTKQLADSYGIPRSTCYGWLKRAGII